MSARDTRHPDRVGAPAWLIVGLALACAFVLGVAGYTVARGVLTAESGFIAGAGAGALAVVGLPSLSVRLVSRLVLLVSAALMVRFGLLSGAIATGGQVLLAWLVAAAVLLVLADRAGSGQAPRLGPVDGGAPARAGGGAVLRRAAIAAGIVALVAAVLAPVLLPRLGSTTQPGEGATLSPLQDGAGPLRSSDALDMTSRPDLTDRVVFTIESDTATFWRGETFDLWDGRRWTRSDGRFEPLLPVDRLRIPADDLGARGDDVVVQRYRIETSYADVIHAAASAVEVDIDRPVRQRADGTLVSVPLGRGATYTVTSRRQPLSPERLRAVDGGEVPEAVLQRYAQGPVTTDRVRELAPQIVAGAETQYDAILAIEAWMGDRIEYSLDAPLAPGGVDVVDHFLFEAEEGWCEQIASSLVVLARANGIPARLVTGFVPGEQDRVTGRYTVRERDAHAWAEVWFPEVGWVPFDPTADVPLAGEDRADTTVLGWLLDHLVVLVLAVAATALAVGPLRRWVRPRLARRRRRPQSWAARTDVALERLGARAGRARSPSETATAHATALAVLWDEPRLAEVGRLVDDAVYAGVEPTTATATSVDELLRSLSSAPTPTAPLVPTG